MNKKTNLYFLLAALVIFGLSSCASTKGIDSAHNARNSLDWAGVYTGTIPSASGTGINVRLRLYPDQRFEMSYEYRDKPNSSYWAGSFQWNETGNIITLNVNANEVSPYYKVAENKLIQLDTKGKPISGNLADDYVLKK